jgi:hypothetical protein
VVITLAEVAEELLQVLMLVQAEQVVVEEVVSLSTLLLQQTEFQTQAAEVAVVEIMCLMALLTAEAV